MTKPRTPAELATSGAALWRDVVGKFTLRPDELRVLEDACREADLVDVIATAVNKAPLMTKGSMGQKVVNPLVSELRQHRTTFASLIRQLKLPDDNPAAAGERSASARSAANARWSKRGA